MLWNKYFLALHGRKYCMWLVYSNSIRYNTVTNDCKMWFSVKAGNISHCIFLSFWSVWSLTICNSFYLIWKYEKRFIEEKNFSKNFIKKKEWLRAINFKDYQKFYVSVHVIKFRSFSFISFEYTCGLKCSLIRLFQIFFGMASVGLDYTYLVTKLLTMWIFFSFFDLGTWIYWDFYGAWPYCFDLSSHDNT